MTAWIPETVIDRLLENTRSRKKDIGDKTYRRPISDYTDPARYTREIEGLFHKLPIVVAHSSQLPKAGDFITHDKLGVPLIIARTKTGEIAAFRNICRHRAAIVESEICGHRETFNCPYHQWSYGLNGALVHIPDEASFDGIDKTGLGLRPVAAAEKYGLVFVRLADGPPIDLDRYLGAMGPELEKMRVADHVLFNDRNTPLRCNWKIMMEGSLEVYHFNFLHAKSAGGQFNAMGTIFDSYVPHQRWVMPKRKLAQRAESGGDVRREILPNYYIFPNTVLTMPHDHMTLTQSWPNGVAECVFYNSLLTLDSPGGPDAEAYWKRALDYTESINREDFVVIEGIQRACLHAQTEDVLYGRFEQGIIGFHEACDEALSGIE